ncbi:MAG: hypothetical protein ABJC09_13860 [Terriglobia bacterium]
MSAKRFAIAIATYVALFAIAFFTLYGVVLKATLLALALFAIKTYIAYRSQR